MDPSHLTRLDAQVIAKWGKRGLGVAQVLFLDDWEQRQVVEALQRRRCYSGPLPVPSIESAAFPGVADLTTEFSED